MMHGTKNVRLVGKTSKTGIQGCIPSLKHRLQIYWNKLCIFMLEFPKTMVECHYSPGM